MRDGVVDIAWQFARLHTMGELHLDDSDALTVEKLLRAFPAASLQDIIRATRVMTAEVNMRSDTLVEDLAEVRSLVAAGAPEDQIEAAEKRLDADISADIFPTKPDKVRS